MPYPVKQCPECGAQMEFRTFESRWLCWECDHVVELDPLGAEFRQGLDHIFAEDIAYMRSLRDSKIDAAKTSAA